MATVQELTQNETEQEENTVQETLYSHVLDRSSRFRVRHWPERKSKRKKDQNQETLVLAAEIDTNGNDGPDQWLSESELEPLKG